MLIAKGSRDLSKRALVVSMPGMFFRGFIELTTDARLAAWPLYDIVGDQLRGTRDVYL
ncbi:MAG: hypothetical protein GF418_07895, partial [Chitinivibrionales bacterium]|nr:hypothetical protein [Chitinivibrionales bacterium]MBD3395534.1 hypothetical protein [Chitinivibrionales bacterium]